MYTLEVWGANIRMLRVIGIVPLIISDVIIIIIITINVFVAFLFFFYLDFGTRFSSRAHTN